MRSLPKAKEILNIILFLVLAWIAYINWRSHAVVYGIENFHITLWLWNNKESLVVLKILSVFAAFLEGSLLVVFSPSIFILTRVDPSPTFRDIVLGVNFAASYVLTKWQDPPKQVLGAQLNASTSAEFKDLAKQITTEGISTHLLGSLCWLCDELSEVVSIRKKLSSTSLCRQLLLLHIHVVLLRANAEADPDDNIQKKIAALGKPNELQPAFEEVWGLTEALLDELVNPESRNLEATYSTLLIGSLGVARNTAVLLRDLE